MANRQNRDETGPELLDALMKAVDDAVRVGKVKRVPNASRTYTRLEVEGETFAYVFPPARSRVSVKIPKQLVRVQRVLPKGHGFKKRKWGLTRTIATPREATQVARALAVAAEVSQPR